MKVHVRRKIDQMRLSSLEKAQTLAALATFGANHASETDLSDREERLLGRFARRKRVIEPAVFVATADELIAAGWGMYPREEIPADFRFRKPPHFNVAGAAGPQDVSEGDRAGKVLGDGRR